MLFSFFKAAGWKRCHECELPVTSRHIVGGTDHRAMIVACHTCDLDFIPVIGRHSGDIVRGLAGHLLGRRMKMQKHGGAENASM